MVYIARFKIKKYTSYNINFIFLHVLNGALLKSKIIEFVVQFRLYSFNR